MMLPAAEWWNNLAAYSQSIFPAQIIFYLGCSILVLLYIFKPLKQIDQLIKIFFIICFGWIGLVFFLMLGQDLPAHIMQAGLFLSIAACFLVDLLTNSNRFHLPTKGWRRTVPIIGFGLVLVMYPLTGFLMGRPMDLWILPGTFPCPTTALALLFISTAIPRKNRWLYAILFVMLLIWAIPFPIMIQIPKYGVYEDGIMLSAGIYTIFLMVLRLKKRKVSLT